MIGSDMGHRRIVWRNVDVDNYVVIDYTWVFRKRARAMNPTHAPELRFHHVSLSVADLDAQQDWYARSLGLTQVIERFELPEPRVRTVVLQAPNGVRIELIERAGSLRSEIYNDPLDTFAV